MTTTKQSGWQIADVLSRPPVYVVSGEGMVGTRELYTGKPTVRAVLARLTRERCGGDRWARVETADGYRGEGGAR